MPAYLGSSAISAAYVGDTAVSKIYLGDTQVWPVAVPVTYVGAAAANATSVSIPTHQAGDLLVIFAWRNNSNSLPGKPSASGTVPTWNDIDATTGSGSTSCRTAYAVAASSGRTSGTWSNAASVAVAVLRDQGASPIGGHAQQAGSANDEHSIAPAVTLSRSDGYSQLLHFHAHTNLDSGGWSGAPTGYTRRASAGTQFDRGVVLNTKNSTTTDGSINQPGGNDLGYGSRCATIEIIP